MPTPHTHKRGRGESVAGSHRGWPTVQGWPVVAGVGLVLRLLDGAVVWMGLMPRWGICRLDGAVAWMGCCLDGAASWMGICHPNA